MHETAIVRNMLGIVLSKQEELGYSRVAKISVCAGKMRAFDVGFMQTTFDWFAEGTPAQGAVLELEEIPIRLACTACAHECGTLQDGSIPALCPRCGAERLALVGGRELYISSLEVE